MPNRDTFSPPPVLAASAAIVAIAATYLNFLLFAQFGFLGLIHDQGIAGGNLQRVLLSMGLGGIGGSLLAAKLFDRSRLRILLLVGFVASGAAALLSTTARNAVSFTLLAAAIGASVGLLTVSLCASIPILLDCRRRGFQIGLGTGIAYGVCNVPALFAGPPKVQAIAGAIACGLGAMSTTVLARAADAHTLRSTDRRAFGFERIVVVFLALVWLDSACFTILEATPLLNRFAWGGASFQWRNGVIHFVAACAAGWSLDRGNLRGVLALSFLLLAGSAAMLGSDDVGARAAGWLYPVGVSLYSTALVFAPGSLPNATSVRSTAWRAALLYVIAGWVGSAMGIGMAQNLHSVPILFLAGSTLIAAVCLILPRSLSSLATPQSIPYWAGLGAIGLLAYRLHEKQLLSFRSPSSAQSPERLGREVYIREGCIHCHSQYVRPGTRDEEWWGPSQPPREAREEIPPLIGNRRQGPDLLRVGNRRSAQWNRLHLINPRSVVPDSRMPSYGHLFVEGDPRGEALVAYLQDLGSMTREERMEAVQRWRPAPESRPVDSTTGARLFAENCAQCHGISGRGDGPLSSLVGSPVPSDLTRSSWLGGTQSEAPERLVGLARIIKFGVPGTTMAGHESLEDSAILGLAAYLARLSARGDESTRAP
jgi:cytochrome c oxidase cbb3-type subunit 2